MNFVIAAVCLLALVNAESCQDPAVDCMETSCGTTTIVCENGVCTCDTANNSTASVVKACSDINDCTDSCTPVTTADPHHHHHEPHEPHVPHPDPEHHHPGHHEELVPTMHCLDGTCQCLSV